MKVRKTVSFKEATKMLESKGHSPQLDIRQVRFKRGTPTGLKMGAHMIYVDPRPNEIRKRQLFGESFIAVPKPIRDRLEQQFANPMDDVRISVKGAAYVKKRGMYRPRIVNFDGTQVYLPMIVGTVPTMMVCDMLAEKLHEYRWFGVFRYLWAFPDREDERFNFSAAERKLIREKTDYPEGNNPVRAAHDIILQIKRQAGLEKGDLPTGDLIDEFENGLYTLDLSPGRPKGAKNVPKTAPEVEKRLSVLENRIMHLEKTVQRLSDRLKHENEVNLGQTTVLSVHGERIQELTASSNAIHAVHKLVVHADGSSTAEHAASLPLRTVPTQVVSDEKGRILAIKEPDVPEVPENEEVTSNDTRDVPENSDRPKRTDWGMFA